MRLQLRRPMRTYVVVAMAALSLAGSPRGIAADAPTEPISVAPPALNSTSIEPGLTAETIVERLMEHNQRRAAALRGFEGKRTYQLSYHGFPSSKDAEMEIVAHYQAPDGKSFDVLSESGSKTLQNKIFARLLESERETSSVDSQREFGLTKENYKFTLLGSRPSIYGGCYRMAVEPKHDTKFLYRGEICVNAADYAVETIDAEPAKNPSFWIKKTHIEHRYQKIGEFWLPESNRTVSNVRMGGTATLNIQYTAYELR
jgi:hypothetical protein